DRGALQQELFGPDFLIERPLLQAMRPHPQGAPVLLIDELDRTDEPFEAFLLEALSDFQISIPEMGTIKAPEPPIVIITSNRTREVHDALKRRCLYHWVDYPDAARELEILHSRVPEAAETLSKEVIAFVQSLRTEDVFKKPGVAETIDWAKCLLALDVISLTPDVIADTIGALLKYQDDIQRIAGSEATRLLDQARASLTEDA
ncbi:MAG: MoxR family ATPase, partial [Pseudomonadota bacterium]|nr:MoxR family ATPase [Pseudomonadota bacterium]